MDYSEEEARSILGKYYTVPFLGQREHDTYIQKFDELLAPILNSIEGVEFALDMVDLTRIHRAIALYEGEEFIKANPALVAHFLPIYEQESEAQSILQRVAYRLQAGLPDYFRELIDKTTGHMFAEKPTVTVEDDDGEVIENEYMEGFINCANILGDTLVDYMLKISRDILIAGKVIVYLDMVIKNGQEYPIFRTINIDNVVSYKINLGKVEYLRLLPQQLDEKRFRQDVIMANPYRIETYIIDEEDNIMVDQRIILLNNTELDEMPLYILGVDGLSNDKSSPPFAKTTNLIAQLYKIMADYTYNLKLTASPMLCLKTNNPIIKKEIKNLVVSPNRALTLDQGDECEFIELKEQSLVSLRTAVQDTLQAVQENRVNFGRSSGMESAEALTIRANSETGFMRSFANTLSGVFEKMIDTIKDIYNIDCNARIQFTNNFMVNNLDDGTLESLEGLLDRGKITPDVLIFNLQRSGLLPSNIDVNQLKELIENSLARQENQPEGTTNQEDTRDDNRENEATEEGGEDLNG